MAAPKSRRFYDALRQSVRDAYEQQRLASAKQTSTLDAPEDLEASFSTVAPAMSSDEEAAIDESIPLDPKDTEGADTRSESRSLTQNQGQSEGQSQGHFQGQSQGQCRGQSQGHFPPKGQSQGQCEGQCEGQSQGHFPPKGHFQGQCQGQSQGHFQGQCDPHSGAKFCLFDDEKTAVCQSLGENPKHLLAAMIAIEQRWICLNHLPLRMKNGALMTYPSKRTAMNTLMKLGFVTSRKKKDYGMHRGLAYTLDAELVSCFQATFSDFLAEDGADFAFSSEYRFLCNGGQSQGQSQGQCELLYGSSSSILKTTTTKNAPEENPPDEDFSGELARLYATHPEYAFWREQHVSVQQFEHWKESFGIADELMDDYLRWCAHDLGVAGRTDKNGSPIDNAQNWFYGLLKRTGAYPRPSGYRSHEELQTELLEASMAQKRALAKRTEELRAQGALSDLQEAFANLIAEGESSPTYCALRESLPPFVREQEHIGRGKIFEMGLWNAFKKLAELGSVDGEPRQ